MRNPVWKLEELLIVLDLYFETDGKVAQTDPRISDISRALRKLLCNKESLHLPKFRNESGVYKKIGNFMSSDPTYKGKGLSHGNSLEPILFKQYINRKAELSEMVKKLKRP